MNNNLKFVFDKYFVKKHSYETVSVDGCMDVALELSHWPGNKTPKELKADTATEIAFNLIERNPEKYFSNIKYITNNHLEADGILAAYVLLYPEKALKFKKEFINSAIVSDFNEFIDEESIKTAIILDSLLDTTKNNLIFEDIKEKNPVEIIQIAYEKAFDLIPDVFSNSDKFGNIWREEIDLLNKSFSSFESRISQISEYNDLNFTTYESNFLLSPYAKFFKTQNDIILNCVKQKGGYIFILEYKPYTWFETVSRKKFKRASFASLAKLLNQKFNLSNPRFIEMGLNPEEDWDYKLVFAYENLEYAVCPVELYKIEKEILEHLATETN